VDDCQSSFESKSDKAEFYKGLRYAIVNSMTGVDDDNIKNLTANCIARRLDTASVSYWRRLAELSKLYVSYIVKVRNSETNYQKLSQQLQDSVETGDFTKLLKEAFYNIPAFSNVTSYNITIKDVTVYPPSSNPTLAPTKKPSSKNKLSGGEIAGIVIGCVAFLAIVVFGTAYYCLVFYQPATEAGKASYTAASTTAGEGVDHAVGELELTDKA